MAQLFHLRCRYCDEIMKKSPSPYCPSCNLYLCYRAMPILLAMLMTRELTPLPLKSSTHKERFPRMRYEHSRYILD